MTKPTSPRLRGAVTFIGAGTKQPIFMTLLICFHLILCAISARLGFPIFRNDYVLYDPSGLPYAIASLAALALISPMFVFARVTFGYFCGFYLFTMIAGYVWLNAFSKFQYDHLVAGVSAIISCAAFLLPALLITSPISQPGKLSERSFERILSLAVLVAVAISAVAAMYGFRVVGIDDIYKYRAELQFPTLLNYAIAATNSVLLPFAFACYVLRGRYGMTAVVLAITLSFYPSTFTKTALFAPAWMMFITLLSRLSARATPVLSLCLPVLTGIILFISLADLARPVFGIVNWRMVLLPSQAMDVYHEYFARHDLTHFCQIRLLKPFIPCALELPLSVEMQNNYALGNFNASLFATEGIASVGPWLAPAVAFVCGLIVALGNRVSAGLSPRFVLISAAVMPQVMMNTPLSTTMLTHGLWILFLLWFVTPRSLFRA